MWCQAAALWAVHLRPWQLCVSLPSAAGVQVSCAGRRQSHTVLGDRALHEHRLLQGAPGWTWELGGLPITGFFSPSLDIVRNKVVHFDLLHEDVSLQYFIPALS